MQEHIVERNDQSENRSSRRLRYSAWFKLLAVLVALAGALVASYALLNTSQLSRAFEPAAYKDSEEYYRAMGDVLYDAQYAALEYRADGDSAGEYALQENAAREASLQRTQALQARYQADISQMVADAQRGEGEVVAETPMPTPTSAEVLAVTAGPSLGASDQPQPTAPFTSEMMQRKEQLDQEIASENASLQNTIDSIRASRKANDERFADCEARLKALDGIKYAAVSSKGEIATNVEGADDIDPLFRSYEHRLIVAQGRLVDNPSVAYRYVWPVYNVLYDMPEGAKLYVAMTPGKFRSLEADYSAQRKSATDALLFVAVGGIATLSGLVWLLYAAGRRPVRAGVVLIASDWPFLDVQLAALTGIVALCGAGIVGMLTSYVSTRYVLEQPVLAICFGALLTAMLLFTVLFLTSAAKRAKRGELLRHTLIFTVVRGIWRGIKNLFMGLKASTRHVLAFLGFVIVYGLIAMIFGNSLSVYRGGLGIIMFMMGFVLVVIALSFVLHKVISFKNLSTAVRRIQAGELGVRVPTGGGTDYAQLAHSINNLADGLKAAVDSEVKSERMRAELVTNVSHDLKTPLTSIVTYVDLLKTEGLTSENAPHYLDVIDQKAARLKTLTADLFEAAKAASGTMPVNLERVDANALLAQGLSELSDRILASGLDMKLQLPADRLLLRADGRLLWRVMENLLSNVFKYALKGSRVYLSAGRLGGRGVLTLKNISAYELNIAPEELTERFTRGDASRHSEGSGLGLSIARSLSELQGGELRIEIDGDLFKAIVSLPVWEE